VHAFYPSVLLVHPRFATLAPQAVRNLNNTTWQREHNITGDAADLGKALCVQQRACVLPHSHVSCLCIPSFVQQQVTGLMLPPPIPLVATISLSVCLPVRVLHVLTLPVVPAGTGQGFSRHCGMTRSTTRTQSPWPRAATVPARDASRATATILVSWAKAPSHARFLGRSGWAVVLHAINAVSCRAGVPSHRCPIQLQVAFSESERKRCLFNMYVRCMCCVCVWGGGGGLLYHVSMSLLVIHALTHSHLV
jgi:hypothetical protein